MPLIRLFLHDEGSGIIQFIMPFLIVAIAVLTILAILCLLFTVGEMIRRRRIGREVGDLIAQDQCRYMILDVREENEFIQKHIADSLNIPFSRINGCFPTENMFERIIVFGPSRRKARTVSRRLDRNGYFNVTHFGAFRSWRGAVEGGPESQEAAPAPARNNQNELSRP